MFSSKFSDIEIIDALLRLYVNKDWNCLIEVEEIQLEDIKSKMLRVRLEDPSYANQMVYYRGMIDSIILLWKTRDLLRKKSADAESNNEKKNGKERYADERKVGYEEDWNGKKILKRKTSKKK